MEWWWSHGKSTCRETVLNILVRMAHTIIYTSHEIALNMSMFLLYRIAEYSSTGEVDPQAVVFPLPMHLPAVAP